MDIMEDNKSKYYAHNGAAELPAGWSSVSAQLSRIGDDEWIKLVRTFLELHASLVGSPRFSSQRTELYLRVVPGSDLEQIKTDVTTLVKDADAERQRFEGVERSFADRFDSLFR